VFDVAEKESTTRRESRRRITDDANTNAKRPPLGIAATRGGAFAFVDVVA
jgi:hypothetical protein